MTEQMIIQCGSGDCWGNIGVQFDATGGELYIGEYSGTGDYVRTWIPFTILLPRNTIIAQAYLTVRASYTSDTDSRDIIVGCEAADNPSTPSDRADLYARTVSAYTETFTLGGYVLNTEYTYQIDNPVQETFQRAGWAGGNTLAVIIDEGSSSNKKRRVYSYEGSATYRAYLTINYTIPFIPRCFGAV